MRARIWFVLLAGIAIWMCGSSGIVSAQTVQLSGSVSPDALKLPSFGDLPAQQTLPLQIWFKPRNQAQLNKLLADQQDPKSSQYHKWLTPQEYTRRFGVSQTEFDKISKWLTNEGFQVTGGSPADGYIKFSGSVLAIGRAFNTRVMKLAPDGSKFGNLSDPQIPAEFSPSIGSIQGLNNLLRVVPMHSRPSNEPTSSNEIPQTVEGGRKSFAPSDFYTFYDENALLNSGTNGNTGGDCLAIYAASDIPNDIVSMFTSTFMPGQSVSLTRKNLDGTSINNSQGFETEALLDVEWAHAAAPGAQIYLYLAQDIVNAVNRVAQDNLCGTINISYGVCGTGDYQSFDTAYAHAALLGISVFVSSGDSGADACTEGVANVSEISATPDNVSVGGTQFNPLYDANGNDSGFVAESVWNDQSGSTGGGASMFFARPPFQLGVAGMPTGTTRVVPDIAMIASPNFPGVFIYDDSGNDHAALSQIGGTSLAAPVWAGISKLIMQENGGSRLGNPDGRIYSLATSSQSGNGFRDVVSGNNSGNFGAGTVTGSSAHSGYDAVTGWGTVDIKNFVIAYAGGTPTPSSSATPTPTPTATPTPTVPAVVKIRPSSVNLGKVKVDKSRKKVVKLTNTAKKKGGATVTMSSGSVTQSGSDFSLDTTCNGSLAPQQTCKAIVTFRPSVPGPQSARVTINSNASNSTSFDVSGTGTCPKKGCP